MRNRHIVVVALGLCLGVGLTGNAYGQKKVKVKKLPNTDSSAEPDKLLYDRAMADIKKAHYTEGRLSLQTLINTYPDSEYLAKAKLAVADSYYKEGGTANMTQAIQEYKDFITFFPFLDEAAYAQMQVGMAYYRMMEKSDRDSSKAESAEDEFQTFLLKYPESPLRPKAEQDLRDVQEVLADGEFRIAKFYYLKPDYRASAARLVELTERYPLYSGGDEALWMLGDVYTRVKQASKSEDDKNHWADLGGQCYARIVQYYPLSKWAAPARERLTSMGMPVPKSDPAAIDRMQKEQLYAKNHRESMVMKVPMAIMKSGPDVSTAARAGQPNLNPPDDEVSATDVFKPGAQGPSFNLAMRPADVGGANAPTQANESGPVEQLSPAASAPSSGPGNVAAAEIIAVGPSGNGSGSASTSAAPPTESTSSSPAVDVPSLGSGSGTASAPAPSTLTSATEAISNSAAPESAPASSGAATGSPAGTETPSLVTTQAATSGNNGSAEAAPEKAKSDAKVESTSKKKKGVHKLIPF